MASTIRDAFFVVMLTAAVIFGVIPIIGHAH